jgi:hypothetical protein
MFSAANAYAIAEKGYDVPAGVAPVTQLHPREMVLPQRYADTIRDLGEGGGGGAGRKHVFVQPQMVGGMLAFTPANLKKMLEDLGHRGHFPAGLA